jgi:sortase A
MKKLSSWLIIVGIIIILIPITGSFYTNYQQNRLYEEYLNSQELTYSIQELDDAFLESTQTDASSAAPIISESGLSTTPSATPAKLSSYKPNIIGKVIIPKVSIDLLLVEGTTSKDLNWGAGHMTVTPMPGEVGNTAIAGHRNYTFGSYFSRLGEVVVGDIVTVEYLKNNYQYEVYEILTVLPNDTSVLAQPKEGSMLTLITCTPKGSNTHRLIVHAKLIS